MKKFAVTCTCGHDMTVDAENMDEAKTKLKEMMTEDAIAKHMQENHKPEEPTPSMDQVHMMIDQTMHEVMAQAA